MNVGDERSISVWMEEAPAIPAGPLTSDAAADAVIIGAGIAGLSAAYELSQAGQTVIVIDRGQIGGGMTARTTAHLASELDDYYHDLIRVRGEREARLYYESQVAAIERIEAICREEAIACDFRRIDGYLIPSEEGGVDLLQDEFDACRKLGIAVEWADNAPMPGLETGRCLRFPDQARFHPTRYLAGLARAVAQRGGRFCSETVHVSDREKDGEVVIDTEAGPSIRAKAAVFATNSPTNDKVAIHTKQMPMRTYAIAGRVTRGSAPDALIWDTLEAYHYVRIQELSESEDWLIVGGEDHRSGEASDMDRRIGDLADWTRRRYPTFREVEYSWSGQVMEPIDFMPFSGRNPGNTNIYVHTGDSGQGITNGVAGALTIASLIARGESRFAELFGPARKSLASVPSLKEFAEGQLGVMKNMSEHLGPGEIDSADALGPGEGGIMREGVHKIALYKDPSGQVIRRSAVCTHAGCVVHWNGFEKCWDCPCHGSQFAPDGEVLNGPAVMPLVEAD